MKVGDANIDCCLLSLACDIVTISPTFVTSDSEQGGGAGFRLTSPERPAHGPRQLQNYKNLHLAPRTRNLSILHRPIARSLDFRQFEASIAYFILLRRQIFISFTAPNQSFDNGPVQLDADLLATHDGRR